MKQFFTIFLSILFTVAYAQHNHHVCGTSLEDQQGMLEFVSHFNKTKETSSQLRSEEIIYAPVKLHLTAKSDGKGRVKAVQVLEEFAFLVSEYKKLGIQLYIQDARFNYLDVTSIYENPGNFGNSIINRKDNDAVNIFITKDATPSGASGVGRVLGYYSPYGDYVVVRVDQIGAESSTLTHELGHYFSLPHTFVGWENVYNHYNWVSGSSPTPWDVEQFDGQYTDFNIAGTSLEAEVMNGTNCTTTSDLICDTPPDYNFGFGEGVCSWPNDLRDRNGDVIDPMEENYMSYFGNCNPYIYTQNQGEVMVANFLSSERDHIRSNYIPDTTHIISDHEMLFPAAAEKLAYYNNIGLDWTDATGASNYLISVSTSGESYEFYSSTSEFLIDELTPNQFYVYSIQPFNEGFTDTEAITGYFTTGSDTNTSVKESEIISNVNIYPNPGQSGNDMYLSFSIDKNIESNIQIMNMTGKSVYNKTQSFRAGANNFRISTADLKNGIYLMKIETEDGSIQKKFIVQ